MRPLTVVQGLEILASWLEDNIGCETELCFDNPEDGTDSAMLLPCVEAALAAEMLCYFSTRTGLARSDEIRRYPHGGSGDRFDAPVRQAGD